MQTTHIALVGMGTVGTGVARLLLEQKDRLSRHAGRSLNLKYIVDPDLDRPRDFQVPRDLMTDDLSRITGDPDVRVVAQLIGGLEPARSVMLTLLDSGKDIVTANKALLAEHGTELFERARTLGRSIAFEASVAGGVPIITGIGQCLSANEIVSLRGILNGTSNFIVSQMEERGRDYASAVAEAQKRGFAEADPSMDVDGTDAAQKLAILAHLAFGARVRWSDIPRVGIDRLDTADLRYAKELGYRIKLLAIAQRVAGGLELHVSPTLVRIGRPLAEVREAYNAISVVGDAVGRVFFHGLGAGPSPTASAVVADIIDTAVGRTGITFKTLGLWSQRAARVSVADHARVQGRFYLRFMVEDRPGVMGEVAHVLGKHNISIASIIQHAPEEEVNDASDRIVPLVIMTHSAAEGAVQKALGEIDGASCIRQRSVRMRVLD
ncbi:MAG: homoserine dehydrogenase [Pirellulaceae bacterium]